MSSNFESPNFGRMLNKRRVKDNTISVGASNPNLRKLITSSFRWEIDTFIKIFNNLIAKQDRVYDSSDIVSAVKNVSRFNLFH